MDTRASLTQRFEAVTHVSLQAQLVHRAYRPLWLNPQFADLFLFDSAEQALAEESLAPLFDEPTRADPEAAWRKLQNGPGVFGRRTMRRRDGAAFRAEIYARRIVWDGEPAAALAILDVDCEERAITECAQARREAEAAALARRQLLAAAAVELHTPLLEAIAALSLDDPCTRNARAACRTLLRRIDDILDSAATDAAALTARPLPFDAAAIIRESIAAERADIALTLTAPAPILVGDRACVRALVRALLHEASRRARGARILCDAEIGPGGFSLCVHVAGAADDPHDGLAPARALAQAMGGVVIEHGKASAWSAAIFAPLPQAQREAEGSGREVLVVDDQLSARRSLQAALLALGCRPTLAASGEEALDLLAARKFDLVLCELDMPRMDGCETARLIRRLPRRWADVPIAAITASTAPGVHDAVADAGMDALLEKPISPPRLEAAILMLTERAKDASVEPSKRCDVQKEHQHEKPDDDPNRVHRTALAPRGASPADSPLTPTATAAR